MAQVVVAVKAFIAWKGAVAAVVKFVLTMAASYAIGRAFTPKLRNSEMSGSPLEMTRDPIAPRRVIYGETRVSGPMVFWHETGTKREFAHVVVALAGHECESIDDVYFNDQVVALDGAGGAIGTYAGLARVKKLLGSPDQTADSDLVAECGGLITSAHRLRNITCLYGRFKYDESKWSSGLPNLSARAKGRKVYDPRTDTTAWSNNPALCVRDYLTNATFGLGVDASEIDDASFIAAANVCDEDVGLAGGGTEKRYTCNGSFEVSAEPAVVLERLCSSFAGIVVYIGGKWVCHAGAYRTPVVTLDESDLRGPISVQTKSSLRDTCNRVKGVFSSPAEKWQMADVYPVVDASALSEDGGVEIWRDMELSFTTSHSMAQRLFKAELRRSRHDKTVKFLGKLTCLRVKAGDVVLVNNTRWGFVAKPFLVAGLKFSTYDVGGEMAIGVDLDLVETSSSVWDWASGEEAIYVPSVATTLGDPLNVPTPTGLTLNAAGSADRTALPRIRVSIDASTDQNVLSGGQHQFAYKKDADSQWITWSTIPGEDTVDFITDLEVGTLYNVRARRRNVFGAWSAWCTPVSLTAPSGLSNYAANLTNDLHGVACDAEGNALSGELGVGGRAFTDVAAWAGTLGLTAVASSPGDGQFSISAALLSGTATFTKVDNDTVRCDTLGSSSAVIRITIDLEGALSIPLDFTLVKVTSGGAYWLVSDTAAVNKSIAGAYTPATVNFGGWAKLLTGAPAAYAGRFIIATFNGTAWTDVYTSAGDEATKAYTVPAGIEAIRCRLYLGGGTSTLLDEEIIPITFDGAAGAPGSAAPPTQFQYSVDGSTSWHSTWVSGDLYVRSSVDGGSTWSGAQRFVGETGAAGGTNKVATPVISFSPASFSSSATSTTCTITCSTSGATIWYQKDGEAPRQYVSAFTLAKLIGLAAWAEKSDMVQSDSTYDMYEDNT